MPNLEEKIGFMVQGHEVQENGFVKVTVRMLNSTKPQLLTNELPIILNSIKHSNLLDPERHMGFDYTLDFPLEADFGFPYCLDFELLSESDRNLI